jgi:hypothetical protein
MFQNDNSNNVYHCPTCGRTLVPDNDRLRCSEPTCPERNQSLFLAYGPRLVLREPRTNGRSAVTMPWETYTNESASR